jgi:hypothetical protein
MNYVLAANIPGILERLTSYGGKIKPDHIFQALLPPLVPLVPQKNVSNKILNAKKESDL